MDQWLDDDFGVDGGEYDEFADGDYVPGGGDDDFDDYEYEEAAGLWGDSDEDAAELEADDLDFPGAYVTASHIEVDSDEEDSDGEPAYEFAHPRHLLELAALLNSASNAEEASNDLVRRLMAGTHVSRPRKPRRWWRAQTEPHPRGLALLRSGEFGPVGAWAYAPPSKAAQDVRLSPKSRRRSTKADDDDEAERPTPTSPPRKRRKRPSQRHRDPLARRPHLYARAGGDAEPVIPNTNGTIVARYPCVPYVGQFCGPNDSIFYSATQYFTLHLYSTQKWAPAPPRAKPAARRAPRRRPGSAGLLDLMSARQLESESESDDEYMRFGGAEPAHSVQEDTSLSRIKTVQGVEGQWTVTDADVDRAGQRMIYSSITPMVHLLRTEADDTEHARLDFRERRAGGGFGRYGFESFGIWSIRFSADGREIVAGASGGNIMVYDIEADRRSLSVQGHRDDVNAVCFADESSTNILVSGSDDGYVKIWDRRSLNASQTPSGVLVGATEGITYASPKGDGRYVIANSKDQACRLYDLRKMRSWSEFREEPDAVQEYGKPGYDYRHGGYRDPRNAAHPRDCSIMTYCGHSVEKTLIRCHFSPAATTGQSYVYSGSADGKIHIWSLDGRVVQVLDRSLSQPLRSPGRREFNDPSAPEPPPAGRIEDPYADSRKRVVRDVAWHSYEPTLMSTCWDLSAGYRRGGSIAKHEWKGLGKNGIHTLEDWAERHRPEPGVQTSRSESPI